MKHYIFIFATVILSACGAATSDNHRSDIQSNKVDTSSVSAIVSTNKSEMEDTTDNDYATFFVVVADTSTDYYFLHKKCLT